MRTRIKICGITRIQDAEVVAESGADALGMNFYEKSPRYISLEQAQSICSQVQPFVITVAVVVDPSTEFLIKLDDQIAIDRIQFQGNESQTECDKATRPYYKALRVKDELNLLELTQQFAHASALLLDTYVKGVQGGSGQTFDWSMIDKQKIDKPIILAGGLSPENVYTAVLNVKPYAVDVSSGVEIKPGIKDAAKINEFIIAVREADEILSKNRNKA